MGIEIYFHGTFYTSVEKFMEVKLQSKLMRYIGPFQSSSYTVEAFRVNNK